MASDAVQRDREPPLRHHPANRKAEVQNPRGTALAAVAPPDEFLDVWHGGTDRSVAAGIGPEPRTALHPAMQVVNENDYR